MVRPSATTGMGKMTMSERSSEAKIRQDNNREHMLPKEYFDGMGSGLLDINPQSRASWSLQLLFFRWPMVPNFGKRGTPVRACLSERGSAPEFTIIVGHTEDAVSFLNIPKKFKHV